MSTQPEALRDCEKTLEGMAKKYMDAADQRDELLQALKDATDAIEHWGAYSSDYFQQKWDLHSDTIERYLKGEK